MTLEQLSQLGPMATGSAALVYLAESHLAGPDETAMLAAVRSEEVDRAAPEEDDERYEYELVDHEEDRDGPGTD